MSGKKAHNHVRAQKAESGVGCGERQPNSNEIAQEFGVHPTQVGLWKKALLENAGPTVWRQLGTKAIDHKVIRNGCYAKIGQLNMELGAGKKKSGISL